MFSGCQSVADEYNEKGYAFPIRVMPEQEALAIRQRLEDVESERGPMHYVVKPYLLMPWLLDLAKRPKILDPVRAILGDDLLLWDSEFIIKEPSDRRIVEWHQDLMYFGLSSDDLVTAWLALSPATSESGCMQFVCGSHKSGLRNHRETNNPDSVLARGQELTEPIDLDNAVDVVLRPGEMSLHHGSTFHASGENISGDRRIGLCLLYIKPSVRQIADDWDSATLVSGVDDYGNFAVEEVPEHEFSDRAVEYQAAIDKRRKSLWRTANAPLTK